MVCADMHSLYLHFNSPFFFAENATKHCYNYTLTIWPGNNFFSSKAHWFNRKNLWAKYDIGDNTIAYISDFFRDTQQKWNQDRHESQFSPSSCIYSLRTHSAITHCIVLNNFYNLFQSSPSIFTYFCTLCTQTFLSRHETGIRSGLISTSSSSINLVFASTASLTWRSTNHDRIIAKKYNYI